MTTDFDKLTEFQKWVIVTMIGEAKDFPFDASFGMEIKINGYPVNPFEMINELESQLDRMIEEKAIEIIHNKIDDITYSMDKFSSQLKEEIESIIKG